MKPSKAAVILANRILEEVGDRYASTEHALTIARLIDEHVKELRDAIGTGSIARDVLTEYETYAYQGGKVAIESLDAAIKPWEESAD